MSMHFRFAAGACLATAVTLFAVVVQAQTFYLGGEGGWSVLQDQTDRVRGLTPLRARFNDGFAAGARAGYEWGPWRFEEEYVYRSNDLNGDRKSTRLNS